MVFTKVVREIFRHLPHSLAAKAAKLASDSNWLDLVQLKIDPGHYTSWYHYAVDRQVIDLVRKLPGLPGLTDEQREKSAYTSFLEGEMQNKRTNDRFRLLLEFGPYGSDGDHLIADKLSRARFWLQRALGDEPPRPEIRFSGGSVYEAKALRTSYGLSYYDKLAARQHSVSSRFLTEIAPMLEEHSVYRHWVVNGSFDVDESDKLLFVDKNALTHRTIIPQSLAMLGVQLGYGRALSRVLGKLNMSKSSAQTRHKCLAARGSWSKDLATIDLKNASNTLSRKFVEYLLPPRWFKVLDACRKTHVTYKGKRFRLEMFSAMGNGYTFELETLLFSSLLAGLGLQPGRDCWVFGDDIIVPEDFVRDLYVLLRYCGLEPNESKSFSGDSPFRESCGGDYFNGHDVTPCRFTSLPRNPIHWIEWHNKIVRIERNLHVDLRRAKLICIDQIPKDLRNCRGPYGLPGVLWDDRGQTWTVRHGSTPRFRSVIPAASDKTLTSAKYCESTLLLGALDGVLSHESFFHQPNGWDGDATIHAPTRGLSGWRPKVILTRSMELGYRVSYLPWRQSAWLPCSAG